MLNRFPQEELYTFTYVNLEMVIVGPGKKLQLQIYLHIQVNWFACSRNKPRLVVLLSISDTGLFMEGRRKWKEMLVRGSIYPR